MKRAMLLVMVLTVSMIASVAKADFTFGEPTNLGPIINSSKWDQNPCISADGLSLYFNSDRSGGLGGTDLWMTTRESLHDDWGAPINLGAPVNSSRFEFPCCISGDGLELYFNDAGYNWGYVPRPGGKVKRIYEYRHVPRGTMPGANLLILDLPSIARLTTVLRTFLQMA